MKKFLIVIVGLIAGLFSVLILNNLFQIIAAKILLGNQSNISLNFILLSAHPIFSHGNSFILYLFIFLTPLIASIIFLEISSLILKKPLSTNVRLTFIIYQLVNIGYLIVYTIISIVAVLLKGALQSDWVELLNFYNYTYIRQLVIMLFILIVVFSYLNNLSKRIKNYIPITKLK